MYRNNTKVKGVNKLTSLAIAALLFIVGFGSTFAQYPKVPVLSLTGQDNGYNDLWFPNGRILMPRNTEYEREFVVPVFIDNRWAVNQGKYTVDLPINPIKSFQFKLFYDSASVTPVGIETTHPKFAPNSAKLKEPLAKGFQINWSDVVDKTYYTHINNSPTTSNRGHAVVITASTNKSLPNTSLQFQDFDVLLYVRFRAVLNQSEPASNLNSTYFHIGRDSIVYNDMNILQTAPFVEYRDYDPQVAQDFPNPQRPNYNSNLGAVFTGLAGMDNRTKNEPPNLILPGGIWFQYMTKQPLLGFQVNRQIGQQPPIKLVDGRNDLYELVDPMTVDLNPNRNPNPFPSTATRTVEVLNVEAGTLLKDIEVVSDQPWLEFKTLPGQGFQNPIPSLSTEGYIPYIDNGLLGEASERDDLNDIPTDLGGISLQISCDPSKIQAGDDATDNPEIEKTGIYTGYITFKSEYADISPVRIKVTFIYFRPPLEGQNPQGRKLNGITLTVANRDGEVDTLIFGTGDRATIGVDSLFGETAYNVPLLTDELDARFYPIDGNGKEIPGLAPFGMSDFATNDEQVKANSRDIRSSDDTTRSLLFKVKFNPGKDNKDQRYPIIITWNRKDFIEGSSLFIRDTDNGKSFEPLDMWLEGTPVPGEPFAYSMKIDDPRIREFIIEYTPAKIVEYVDDEGNPIINVGWNLLSLPVQPLGNLNPWKPGALNDPYYFFLNSYQQETDGTVRPGVGYFLKYNDTAEITRTFRGTNIFEVSPEVNPVRVYTADENRGGWNAVGAPSVPINVEALDFRAVGSGNRPDKNYMLEHGVWKYVTKEGYKEVNELRPGLGYWIKVDENGYYYFNTANPKLSNEVSSSLAYRNNLKAMSTEIVVSDNNQSAKSLFVSNSAKVNSIELPPLPPSFDVRFEGNTELTNNNEAIIQLTNVVYPVSISAKGLNGTFELTDAATGEYFGTISSDDYSSVEISASSNSIRLNKVEVAEEATLNSVYPNPVLSDAIINFNLPESGNVNVTLIDAVGNTVANIFNGNMNAGSRQVDFQANGVASGNYFVKIEGNSFNKVMRLQVVK